MMMRNAVWGTLLLAVLTFGQGAWADDFVEGIDYQRIDPALPTDSADRVEVAEYFWYGCPHCFHLEPEIEKWVKTLPDTAVFRRVAADFDGRWALLARTYYTAQALGVLDRIHQPLFDAIHVKKQHFKDEAELADFFKDFGVSADDFSKAFHSFTVESKYRRAVSLRREH